jgi:hypothetical protein
LARRSANEPPALGTLRWSARSAHPRTEAAAEPLRCPWNAAAAWHAACVRSWHDHAPLVAATTLLLAAAFAAIEPNPATAGVLRIGLADDPDMLDPTLARTYTGRIVFAAMCDKLVDITPELDIAPQLATELVK